VTVPADPAATEDAKMEMISDDYAQAKHHQPQGPIPESGPVQVELVWTNVYTRWPCTVCGGCTEKVGVLAEGPGRIRVCEQCLKDGDIDGQLERTAASFERDAAATRALIGRLKVPSYEEWEQDMDRCDAHRLGCSVEDVRKRKHEEAQAWIDAIKAQRDAKLTDDVPFF
jgi:hypothetical protein